jgi:hypothetical protein
MKTSFPVQAGVVRVRVAKATETAGVCVAVIGDTNVTKVWTPRGITPDCCILQFGLQRKFPRQDIVPILQRKKKTPQTRIGLVVVFRSSALPVPLRRLRYDPA